jgi:phage N-6-adenine-methyltransferase
MSALEKALLSRAEARSLTDEVKGDAERLWRKLLELYEGEAWTVLGYDSWRGYWLAEFGEQSLNLSYKQIAAGRAMRVIEAAPVYHGTKPNERQARELAPLLDEPEQLRDAWQEVVDEHPEPTAANVREVVQSRMGVHYSSATDLWSTPQDLFDQLDEEFGFTLDVCAIPDNAKCTDYFTAEQDGLAQEWRGVCWMNPPYGDAIARWVEKAYQSGKSGATVVCLVPARVDTGWWWNFCRYGEIRFLRGRLKFGGADTGAPFPSAVVVFGREPNALQAHWDRER